MSIKLSKRIKDNKRMITPGQADSTVSPSSAGAGNAGVTLDYRAIQVGDNSQLAFADDGQLKASKAPDFAETGTYLVNTPNGTKKIYRDPENREWYEEDSSKHYSQSWLGSTQKEALDRLAKLYSNVVTTNEADDEEEGEKYPAHDLTSNWWVADHRIKLVNKLWEKATALSWPWINKVQLSRIKQNDDGSWQEVYKIVDMYDELILLPLSSHAADDFFGRNFSNNHYNNAYVEEIKGRGSFIGSRDDGFELRHALSSKQAFPTYQQYSDTNTYEQIINPRNETEPELNAFEDMGIGMAENRMAGYADDYVPNMCDKYKKLRIRHDELYDDSLRHGGELYSWDIANVRKYAREIGKLCIDIMAIDDGTSGFVDGFLRKAISNLTDPKDVAIDNMMNVMVKCDLALTYCHSALNKLSYLCHSKDDETEVMDEEIGKTAFPDYPAYVSSPMYEQVTEKQDYNMTPQFDMWNANAADDVIDTKEQTLFLHPGTEIELFDQSPGAPPEGAWLESRIVKRLVYKGKDGKTYIDYEVSAPWTYAGTTDISAESYGKKWRLKKSDIGDEVEVIDGTIKEAFVKTAVTYDSNSVIQDLIKIPQVKALIDQQASGFVDKIIVTTVGADVQQTQQTITPSGQPQVNLQPISGNPYGHMWTSEDPTTHQKMPLDKIVRIDRVTDAWGTLSTILHEIAHHRHPDWSEGQVEAEAQRNADTVKQFLTKSSNTKKMLFVKNSLTSLPIIECEHADTYQKQVIGLQNHKSLSHKTGMLFSYKNAQALSFHMGTVAFPIDIIFANASNKILKIYRNCQPNSRDIYSCDNASKVIEVIGSLCAFHDLDVGDHVFEVDDEAYKQEDFAKYILQKLQEIKAEQQEQLEMKDWNIKIVMKKDPDRRRFLKVTWTPEDYKFKKADILVNPDPLLISAALKKLPLEKLVRHALLHILAGYKDELSENRENEIITRFL